MSRRAEQPRQVERRRWKFERDADKAAARAAIPPAPAPANDDATSIDEPVPYTTAGREVLNDIEAAEFLGLSRDTVRNYANAGTIPNRRVGDRLLFSRTALVRWLSHAG